jgi:hypothetical protein
MPNSSSRSFSSESDNAPPRAPSTIAAGTGSVGILWLIDPGIRSTRPASNTPSTAAPNSEATAAVSSPNRASSVLASAVVNSAVIWPSSMHQIGCSPCPLAVTSAGSTPRISLIRWVTFSAVSRSPQPPA